MKIDEGKALDYLNKALSIDRNLAMAYTSIGFIYDKQNKIEDAFNMYEQATKLSEWNQKAINNSAYHYLLRKKYHKAIERYELLLSLDKYQLISYLTLAQSYQMIGDLKNAYKKQKYLVQLFNDKKVTALRRNKDTWFFYTEPYEGVTFDIDNSLEKKCYAYYCLALTCYLLDRQKEARVALEKAQKLQNDGNSEAKELLEWNIDQLGKEQKSFRQKLDEFKKTFLQKSEAWELGSENGAPEDVQPGSEPAGSANTATAQRNMGRTSRRLESSAFWVTVVE
jgi:tetratricopeptide (TPR) repeat protein